MSYTEADVDQLGETLASLPLSAGERDALHALIAFAAPSPSDVSESNELDQSTGLKQELHRVLFEPALA